jgi:hypothetical protein
VLHVVWPVLLLPVLLEQLLGLSVGFTDKWLAGNLLEGAEPLAAVGLVAYCLGFLPGLFAIPAIAATALVSRTNLPPDLAALLPRLAQITKEVFRELVTRAFRATSRVRRYAFLPQAFLISWRPFCRVCIVFNHAIRSSHRRTLAAALLGSEGGIGENQAGLRQTLTVAAEGVSVPDTRLARQ